MVLCYVTVTAIFQESRTTMINKAFNLDHSLYMTACAEGLSITVAGPFLWIEGATSLIAALTASI
jgi:hypothetical protein